MKFKFTAFLLLFCLIAPSIVTFVWFKQQKAAIKREIKWLTIDGVDLNELVKLKFTKANEDELRWEHAREFEFKQQMYDIVESEMNGDTTIYWCWLDNEETQLNKKLNNLVANALGHDTEYQDNQHRLKHFFKSLCLPLKQEFSTIDKANYSRLIEYECHYLMYGLPPSTPPPELV